MSHNFIIKFLPALLLPLLITFNAFIFCSSLNKNIPLRDSGFYLYAGQQILSGAVPYVDFWDHKPPLVFIINAFSQKIVNISLLGIWITEFISINLVIILGYFLLRSYFGDIISFVTILIFSTSFFLIFEGGNSPEEFGLLFQFIFLLMARCLSIRGKSKICWFMFGLLSTLAMLLKQTLIAIPLAILLITIFQTKLKIKNLIWWSAGNLVTIIMLLGYLIVNHALFDFIDQVIYYNLIYTSFNKNYLQIINYYLQLLSPSLLIETTIFALIIIAWQIFKNQSIPDIIKIAVFALPLQLFLIVSSGRSYPHYFISVLPIITILLSYLLWKISTLQRSSKLAFVVEIFFCTALLIQPAKSLKAAVTNLNIPQPHQSSLINYLKSKNIENQYILVWGAESWIYYLSNNVSSTKYAYQYPLYTKKYQNTSMIEELLAAIKAKPPQAIIDVSADDSIIPPLNCIYQLKKTFSDLTQYGVLAQNQNITNYICQNYHLDLIINHYLVYLPN